MRWLGLVPLFLGVACLSRCSGKGEATSIAPLYAVYEPLLTFSSAKFLQGSLGEPEH